MYRKNADSVVISRPCIDVLDIFITNYMVKRALKWTKGNNLNLNPSKCARCMLPMKNNASIDPDIRTAINDNALIIWFHWLHMVKFGRWRASRYAELQELPRFGTFQTLRPSGGQRCHHCSGGWQPKRRIGLFSARKALILPPWFLSVPFALHPCLFSGRVHCKLWGFPSLRNRKMLCIWTYMWI